MHFRGGCKPLQMLVISSRCYLLHSSAAGFITPRSVVRVHVPPSIFSLTECESCHRNRRSVYILIDRNRDVLHRLTLIRDLRQNQSLTTTGAEMEPSPELSNPDNEFRLVVKLYSEAPSVWSAVTKPFSPCRSNCARKASALIGGRLRRALISCRTVRTSS